jgi:hypothetical protein
MTTQISVNAAKVLDTMIALAPVHGSYYAMIDIKNAFSGQPFSHVSEVTIEQLRKEGITLADVVDAMKVHSEHNKLLQQYIASEMTNNTALTAHDVAVAIQLLLRPDAKPALAGSPQAVLQNAGINAMDTSFVFTPSRLNGVDALVHAHVPPASAFAAIDQMRGEYVNALPENIKIAADRISSLVKILVNEQHLSFADMKSDLRNVIKGQQTIYAFKNDYVTVYQNLKDFMELNMRGLDLEEFVMAFFTPEFIREIELSVIVAKEADATDMVYTVLYDHIILPAAYLPTTLAKTHVNELFNLKMHRINQGLMIPWSLNHTGFDFPKPVCPAALMPSVLDNPAVTTATYNEGMVAGVLAMGALWMATKLAYPAYQNIIKPAASKTLHVCNALGLLMFSGKDKFKSKESPKQSDEQAALMQRYSA